MSATGSQATARAIRSACLFTHRRPEETGELVTMLVEAAKRAGVELYFDAEEAEKHQPRLGGDSRVATADPIRSADVCVVFGGDGTTLRALRTCAGTDVPVFSVNCGRIGFLATVDKNQVPEALEYAISGRFEVERLPALVLGDERDRHFAINEVSFQRGSNMNVANLSYALAGEEVARAPCDGLIAATPAGSTGYNLSAGGPILAWEVEAFVVGMVAPHALSARSVVAAPDHVLSVANEGGEPVDVVIDGERKGELAPGADQEVRFKADAVGLAQLPGANFYSRFREKLGMLRA